MKKNKISINSLIKFYLKYMYFPPVFFFQYRLNNWFIIVSQLFLSDSIILILKSSDEIYPKHLHNFEHWQKVWSYLPMYDSKVNPYLIKT